MKNWQAGLILLGVLLGVFLFRLAWAELVYHDKRCAWAECRIVK